MKEALEQTADQAKKNAELLKSFDALDETGVADSIITGKLFESGQEGALKVVKKISEMKTGHMKDSALFRIAKLYYEFFNDLQSALMMAEKIQNQDEKTRCLVQLAVEVLKKEGNPELADDIIKKVVEDNKEYVKYYEKVKKEYLENKKSR